MTKIDNLNTDCSISAADFQTHNEIIKAVATLTITAITVLGGVLFCTNNLPVIRNDFSLSLGWAIGTAIITTNLASDILLGFTSFHPSSKETTEEKHKRIADTVVGSIQFIALISYGYGFLPLLKNSILVTTIATFLASEFAKDVTKLTLLYINSSLLHHPTEAKPITIES